MSEVIIDRRQILAGVGAAAIVASMPTVAAAAVEVADPAIERMKVLLHQLLDLLRSEGYAVAPLKDGGRVLFWLHVRGDITSMKMMALGDEPTPDVVEVLKRAAAIEPTVVM